MNILFDATVFELPFSGIAKSTLYLYDACIELDNSFKFTGFFKKRLSNTLPNKYNAVKLKQSLFNKQYTAKNINTIISKDDFNIIHFPWNGNIPRDLLNVKKVMTLHDVLPLEIPNYFKDEQQRIKYYSKTLNDLNQADVIFTDSEYSKSKIIESFPIKKEPVVLPFGPTIKPVSLNSKLYEEPFFIYVGGYDKRKGIRYMLESFLYLYKTKKTAYKLFMIGQSGYIDSETKEILNQCIEANIVKQMGYVSDETLAEYYSSALGLVYLSKYEGFGLPPLEAMSLGCPVITTKYSSLPEICSDAVLYVEPESAHEVTNAISSLASNQKLRESLQAAGKVQSAKFSWEKSAKLFLSNIK